MVPADSGKPSSSFLDSFGASQSVNFGRPNLDKEFAELAVWRKEAVVFVCGPQGLSNDCSALALKHSVSFKTEEFEF